MEAKGQGIIIADQTGIGKGRIASAIIRYATNKVKSQYLLQRSPIYSLTYIVTWQILVVQTSNHLLSMEEMPKLSLRTNKE
jgi:hypothetical protein